MENSYLPYRYYTSVGIYQGYNSDSRQHFVLVRSSQENLCENEKRYHIVSLDEFQFMIWYACHGEIISEDDMYEIASKMWEKADGHKKPLLRCIHELEELQLLSMKESATKEECMLNLVQSIQPFQQSLSMCHNFKSFASYMLKRAKSFSVPFLHQNSNAQLCVICRIIRLQHSGIIFWNILLCDLSKIIQNFFVMLMFSYVKAT